MGNGKCLLQASGTRRERLAAWVTHRENKAFARTAANRAWAADITYVPTDEGWLYLAVVLDLYSRRVIGWAMAAHLQATLVIDAYEWQSDAPLPRTFLPSCRSKKPVG